jgi:type II secretory pathway component GspD/PulD (secretin)
VPDIFPQVQQIIDELDKKPPQVLIEAQIVEIDSARDVELGFEWGSSNGELASYSGPQRDTMFPLNLPNKLSNAHFFDPIANVISAVGATGGSSSSSSSSDGSSSVGVLMGNSLKTGILDLTSLKVSLRAMVSRSEARYLGKPKILTLNNKSALIEVISNQAVAMEVNNSGGTSVTNQTITPQRYDTGLKLKVTPQVNKEGYITLLVQPSYTNAQVSALSTTINPVYDPITRGASSLVRIRNGQTLVMGGLLQSTETKIVRKVPILGYIPILGWLFTSSSNQKNNSDLVIFLTPTIVND